MTEPGSEEEKSLEFSPGVREDLREMPLPVRKDFGHSLWLIQNGETPGNVSEFEGSKAREVMKIVERYDGDTYRVVFAARFEKAVYVLHAFKKKSTSGIATPQRIVDTVYKRLQNAKVHYERVYRKEEAEKPAGAKSEKGRRVRPR